MAEIDPSSSPRGCIHHYPLMARLRDWWLRLIGQDGWVYQTRTEHSGHSAVIARTQWVYRDEPAEGWVDILQAQCACGYWMTYSHGGISLADDEGTDSTWLKRFADEATAEAHLRRLRMGIPDRWPVGAAVLAVIAVVAAVTDVVVRLMQVSACG